MAINNLLTWGLLFVSSVAGAREAATPGACQAAASTPPIADARDAAARNGKDLRAQFRLADAWSEVGCFNDALQVLVAAQRVNPGNTEIDTRLRVARSVVGEEHFFDNLDRAEDQARVKRATFRCTSLSDSDACSEALRAHPEDAALWTAQGDALMRAGQAARALDAYRHAATLNPDQADLERKTAVARNQSSSESAPVTAVHAGAGKINAAGQVARVPAAHALAAARRQSERPPNSASNSNVEPESHSR